MPTPMETMMKTQLALYNGWVKLMLENVAACERLVEHQSRIFTHPDHHRAHDVIATGADLKDHYGQRAHDVDVEDI